MSVSRPILFQPAMVRALLEGRKTQTRRILKKLPLGELTDMEVLDPSGKVSYRRSPGDPLIEEALARPGYSVRTVLDGLIAACPYGQVGDTLWVRESWQPIWATAECPPFGLKSPEGWAIGYPAADGRQEYMTERGLSTACHPSIHMPRWASRLTLTVTDVRVQHLNEISREDAVAEGAECHMLPSPFSERPRQCWSMDWADQPGISPDHGFHDPRFAFVNYLERLHGGPRWNCKPYEQQLWPQNLLVYAVSFAVAQTNLTAGLNSSVNA